MLDLDLADILSVCRPLKKAHFYACFSEISKGEEKETF